LTVPAQEEDHVADRDESRDGLTHKLVGARPRMRFTLPRMEYGFERDPKVVVLQPFTLREELDANAAAEGSDTTSVQYELLRRCVVEIDGKPVSDFDWLENTSPACRVLLNRALTKISLPTEKDNRSFFRSGVSAD
jgi:hypothetical protein